MSRSHRLFAAARAKARKAVKQVRPYRHLKSDDLVLLKQAARDAVGFERALKRGETAVLPPERWEVEAVGRGHRKPKASDSPYCAAWYDRHGNLLQCRRKAVVGGYCGIHAPKKTPCA